MKRTLVSLIFSFILLSSSLYSQPNEIPEKTLQKVAKYFQKDGEIYFKFKIIMSDELETLTRIISIDNVIGNVVYAYANKNEFEKFKQLGYDIELLSLPYETATGLTMSDNITAIQAWDVYPTYSAYITMMNNFAVNYPTLCRIVDAGTTPLGKKILFAVISKNVTVREPEPRFMYTSSMHGDETTGYVLMLRLIDTLLSGYATNPQISYLMDNMEIWINPLANPDGTYRSGNTISSPRRGNNNNIDLNRNFPDPVSGPHPDGNAYQSETTIFMNIATSNYFTMSANFHGGAEVVNYPWDSKAGLTADNSWWVYVSRQYVDTVHKYAVAGYMDDLYSGSYPGVTNGYAWYVVHGGRQDYMTYFKRGRECTIEISATKLLPAAQLPAHWNYNQRSFFNYMRKALYGLTGLVTSSVSGVPVKAKITVNIDMDSSEVYSDSATGKYNRMLYAGTYTVTASAPGYDPKTFNNIVITNDAVTNLNIQLDSVVSPANLTIKALLQGFYNGTIMIPKNLKVILRNSTPPYLLVDSQTVLLNSSGSGNPVFTKAVNGTPYYIVLKFNNGIETWSTTPQTFSGSSLSYDFTTSETRAYGSNMILIGTKWCLFVGDINQDGSVDALDMISVDNDVANFVIGNVVTDLNGDLSVDALDMIFCDNNTTNFITSIKPPGAPDN